MQETIYGLSNEAYHNSEPYTEYLSSTQIKRYMVSPKAAKYAFDHPDEFAINEDAAAKGSLFHFAMEQICLSGGKDETSWKDSIAVFEPPTNPKTGASFGVTSQKYQDALAEFKAANEGKQLASADDIDLVSAMVQELLHGCLDTSEQVRSILRWGKPEVSHFVEYEGCKFKYRPDVETKKKIIDWKTLSVDDLHEDTITRTIIKFGYDISAAMYQFMEHERTGEWKQFFWVMQQKTPPYDAVFVSAENWGYTLDDDGLVQMGIGAMKFSRLLECHIECTKSGEYPGAQTFLLPGFKGRRIMSPEVPAYENNKLFNFFK